MKIAVLTGLIFSRTSDRRATSLINAIFKERDSIWKYESDADCLIRLSRITDHIPACDDKKQGFLDIFKKKVRSRADSYQLLPLFEASRNLTNPEHLGVLITQINNVLVAESKNPSFRISDGSWSILGTDLFKNNVFKGFLLSPSDFAAKVEGALATVIMSTDRAFSINEYSEFLDALEDSQRVAGPLWDAIVGIFSKNINEVDVKVVYLIDDRLIKNSLKKTEETPIQRSRDIVRDIEKLGQYFFSALNDWKKKLSLTSQAKLFLQVFWEEKKNYKFSGRLRILANGQ